MLFKYNFIADDADKLQVLARHIVIDIWCNATATPFDMSLVDNTNFTLIDGTMDNMRAKVNRTEIYLKNPIKEIYNICSTFTQAQKDYIRDTFERNNNIEAICNNTIMPIFYDQLEVYTSEDFSSKVKIFFNNLYKKVFNSKPFYINTHYDKFMSSNKKLCPTCGLNTLEADSSNHRDDYDHYLPKKTYPFTAVNLRNLMPICSDCNKKWKGESNPAQYINISQKSYYYYGTINPNIKININIKDLDNCDIDIILTSATMQDEVDTWNRIYSIGRRYRDVVVCHMDVGKGWFRKIKADIDRNPSYNLDSDIEDAKNNLLENQNFVKAPFLEECKNKGLLFDEENVLMNMLRSEFPEELV